MRTLLLLRHARAEAAQGDDHARGLTDTGRTDAAALGRRLRDAGLLPELVLCSDAVRAQQTWETARAELGGDVATSIEPGLYDIGAAGLVNRLAEVDDAVRTLLVVGHEPTMSTAAAALAGPGSDDEALARVRAHLPTCGLVILRLDRPWSGLEADGCALTGLLE
jgi:phosphohistidine phosphatase